MFRRAPATPDPPRLADRPVGRLVGHFSAVLHNAGSGAVGPDSRSCLSASMLNVQPGTNVCSISHVLAFPRNATCITPQCNCDYLTLSRNTSQRTCDYLTLPRNATGITSHYLALGTALPRNIASIISPFPRNVQTQIGMALDT